MALEPSRLADFQLLGPIGKGATSQVFDAVHRATGRPVAIKTLQIASNDDHHEIVERFAREALVVANVRSRYVGQILGFGFDRAQPFLVLERLRGETIDSLLRRERVVPVGEGLVWMAELMAGLADCHAVGVIHRDIKPANVFLVAAAGEPRYAKVIDFGVARTDRGMEDLTSAQHLLGSVGYMAPEQFISALGVGPSADIYAVGVTIFRCFAGRLPFISKNVHDVIRRKLEQDAPLLSSIPDAPRLAPLDAFLGRALARDPQVRFRTVREMLESWGAMRRAIEALSLLRPNGLLQEEVMTSEAVSSSVLFSALTPDLFLDSTKSGQDEFGEPVTVRKPSDRPRVLVPFASNADAITAPSPDSVPWDPAQPAGGKTAAKNTRVQAPDSVTFSVPIPSFAKTSEVPSVSRAPYTPRSEFPGSAPKTPQVRRRVGTPEFVAPIAEIPVQDARITTPSRARPLAKTITSPVAPRPTPAGKALREDDGPTQTYAREELDRLVADEAPHLRTALNADRAADREAPDTQTAPHDTEPPAR